MKYVKLEIREVELIAINLVQLTQQRSSPFDMKVNSQSISLSVKCFLHMVAKEQFNKS